MTWDETGGWVFTDEYHRWQDRCARGNYRHGTEQDLRLGGWPAGLFSLKPLRADRTDESSWPAPADFHDLDRMG